MLTPDLFLRVRRLADLLAGIELGERHSELIGSRMRRLGLEPASLIAAAEHGEVEAVQRLIGLLTTNHTAFFRHPGQLELAAAHAVQAMRCRGSARIWSAAASTGEEAWSLALLLVARCGGEVPPVSILATDIDRAALAVAAAGVYSATAIAAIPAEHRHAVPDGRIAAPVRAMVRFLPVNLAGMDWPVTAPLDVVLCRNVLMYLGPEHRYAILERIAGLLQPDGLLLLDPSEHLGAASVFFSAGSAGVYGLRRRIHPQRTVIGGSP